jgi:hypothetical protein
MPQRTLGRPGPCPPAEARARRGRRATSWNTGQALACTRCRCFLWKSPLFFGIILLTVPSSSGPGRWPLTPETGVRNPLGLFFSPSHAPAARTIRLALRSVCRSEPEWKPRLTRHAIHPCRVCRAARDGPGQGISCRPRLSCKAIQNVLPFDTSVS